MAKTHILEEVLPWRRDVRLTYCGRADPAHAMTLDEFQGLVTATSARLGRPMWIDEVRRHLPGVCMTCASRANYSESFSDQPVRVLRFATECSGPREKRLAAELRAMAALVELHRDEFDLLVAGNGPAAKAIARSYRSELLAQVDAEYERSQRELLEGTG